MLDLGKLEQIAKPPLFNNLPFLQVEDFSFRYEYKYFITTDMYENLKLRIRPIFETDKYCLDFPHKAYPVRSVYWDSEDFICYRQKIDGVMHRYKYRYRAYVEKFRSATELYLEIKGKDGKKITKYRSHINWDILENIKKNKVEIDQTFLPYQRQQEIVSFLDWERKIRLSPVVAVRYEREAYIYRKDDKVRINFDRDIYFRKADSIEDMFTDIVLWEEINLSNLVIFEIKIKSHHTLPFELKKIIEETHIQAMSISKYCYAVDHCGVMEGIEGLTGGEYVRKSAI